MSCQHTHTHAPPIKHMSMYRARAPFILPRRHSPSVDIEQLLPGGMHTTVPVVITVPTKVKGRVSSFSEKGP